MAQPPLHLTIELVRSQDGADRYHFEFTAQKYKRRVGPGTYQESQLPWSQRVLDALQGLNPSSRNPEDAQYLGHLLRTFLAPLDWDADERELERALKAGREVHLTLRFAAAELYVLPWELVTLRNSGRHLGAIPGCHLRYEAPRDEEPFDPSPAPPVEEGRLLFAWSAAGGDVPVSEHLTAIQQACKRSAYPFDARADVLNHVSLAGLGRVLQESKKPVAVLHILCHGGPRGPVFGLHWSPEDPGAESDLIDAAHLRELLAPYAESLRLVVLCACTSGDTGPLGRHLGSVAQGLHAIGIRAVIASRLPLSVEGSQLLTKTLYEHLLVRHTSLQRALAAAREALKPLAQTMDWATLQLYSRQDEPLHQFPFVFRPYQGLLSFDQKHCAFFFGRGVQQKEWLERLHEAERGDRPRLQVLAGPSGSGKSSLAKAAILTTLGAEGWEVVAKRLVEPGLLSELRRLQAERPRGSRVLLVDQFEELFARPLDEREPLVRALWELSRTEKARTVVLLTLRLDALERCSELRLDDAGTVLSAIMLDPKHHVFLHPLQADQYREAILGPAQETGLSFEPGLVEQLVRDAGQEPGALPLLEHALDLLWEKRERYMLTQAAYHALGGLTGALTRTVDQLYERLSSIEQRQMRRLLVELVDFRDGLALSTRRREQVARLRPVAPAAREAFDVVVEQLVSQRLLVRGKESGAESVGGWIEVAHEALIRRWERLGQWLREDGERVLALRTVRGWAQEWVRHQIDSDGGAGYLPTGSRLAYVRELRERYPEDLDGPVEKEFIEAAEAAGRQRDKHFLASVRVANRLLVGIRDFEGMPGMDLHRKSLLEQVERMLDNLIQSAGTRPVALRARAVACTELGDVALEHGKWDEAQRLYERAMKISYELYEQAPADIMARKDLAVCHVKRGFLEENRGSLDQAHEHYEQALRLTEQLAREQPEDMRLQRALARTLESSSGLELARKNLDLAQSRIERALVLLNQPVSDGPTQLKLKLQKAACLDGMGRVALARGNFAAAESHYRAALDILGSLPGAVSTGFRARRRAAQLYTRLGWLAFGRQAFTEALQFHLNALHLLEALGAREPRNTFLQRELALSLMSMGVVKVAEKEIQEAQGYLAEARSKLEALVLHVPTHAQLRVDLLMIGRFLEQIEHTQR
jgi:tetratricopeptide (TPR) repeat protein